jgi:membrane protease YdiL (CAAX protease family)
MTIGDSPSLAAALPFDLMMWGLLAAILIIVVRVERKPLASIGLRPPGWLTIFWSLALTFAMTLVLVPGLIWLIDRSGLPGYEYGMRRLLELPVWYRVFLAITAGVVEEALYRGYAVERLASLTGSYWAGGSIAVIVFSLVHFPSWGIGPTVVVFGASIVMTLFYVWKQDLLALMIAHAIGDTIGLVLLPLVNSG